MTATDPAVEQAAVRIEAEGFGGPYACAVVTGTGLGALADRLGGRVSVPYSGIPDFPLTDVSGHRGALHRGVLEGRRVLIFEGRIHSYERGDPAAMGLPIGLAKRLGTGALLLTSASGSLYPAIGPGSIVLVRDHINLSGLNSLIGATGDDRFVPMTRAYDPG